MRRDMIQRPIRAIHSWKWRRIGKNREADKVNLTAASALDIASESGVDYTNELVVGLSCCLKESSLKMSRNDTTVQSSWNSS